MNPVWRGKLKSYLIASADNENKFVSSQNTLMAILRFYIILEVIQSSTIYYFKKKHDMI